MLDPVAEGFEHVPCPITVPDHRNRAPGGERRALFKAAAADLEELVQVVHGRGGAARECFSATARVSTDGSTAGLPGRPGPAGNSRNFRYAHRPVPSVY